MIYVLIYMSYSQPRILHLVLFSHDIYYDRMYTLLSPYYAKSSNVRTYFYTYSPDLSDDYTIIGNILYIKGTESYVPGILEKTIKAFQYFAPLYDEFDYVVRTNISTITNLQILSEQLIALPLKHGTCWLNTIQYIHPSAGITDFKWFGTKFASGSNIIFSIDVFREFMSKIDHIRMNIVDDVSIGIYLREHLPHIVPELWNPTRFFWTHTTEQLIECLPHMYNHKIFYRNRMNEHSQDREPDIENMKRILALIDR
jgi:hypothetical protein